MANFNLNLVQVGGRVTAEPRAFTYGEGKTGCGFSVAVNGQKENDPVTYFDVTTFGKTAEFVGRNVKKGTLVYVTGPVTVRSSEKDGKTYARLSVTVDQLTVIDGYKEKDANAAPAANDAPAVAPVDDDEATF